MSQADRQRLFIERANRVRLFARLAVVAAMFASGCAVVGSPEKDVDAAVREIAAEIFKPGRQQNYQYDIAAPDAVVTRLREQTYLGRWQYREDFDPSQYQGLVARLPSEATQIMQSKGYFNSTSEVQPVDAGVRLVVKAGARTTVNKVELNLIGEATERRSVRKYALSRWALPEGSFFDSEAWQKSKRDLLEGLNQQGYLRAKITKSQATINRQLTAASVALDVQSGPRIAFGALEITGLTRYSKKIVEDLRPFRPGVPYTLDNLLTFQARLRGAGYFSDASVVPRLDELENDPDAMRVNIAVNLTELSSKRAVFGIGYSTDEGPRGQLGLEHRDLFNWDWQLESALVLSQKRQRAFANVRTPYDENNYFNGFGGRVEREDIEEQVSTRSNTYIGRGRRVGNIESFLSLQYQLERLRLATTGRVTTQRALVLGYSWNLRKLDSSVDPRRGYTLSAQLSGARRGLATDRSFVRFYGRAMRFLPMPADSRWRNGTLIALAEFGIVRTREAEDIPTENLFRTGGAQTVRGYRYQSLGVPKDGAVIGGRFLAVGSLEYQHRVTDTYSLAAFFDYGMAADSVADYVPVAGYGLGIRFRTPVGPINLDLAYGRQLGRYRAHFSVGYTF